MLHTSITLVPAILVLVITALLCVAKHLQCSNLQIHKRGIDYSFEKRAFLFCQKKKTRALYILLYITRDNRMDMDMVEKSNAKREVGL